MCITQNYQNLKLNTNVISPRYHQEYLSMSWKSTDKDALVETDDEDDTNLV